jgi:hypothetical protein
MTLQRQFNDNTELALMNIPRLQRCEFQGVCEHIVSFLSPQDFDNLLILRSILPKLTYLGEPSFDRNKHIIAPLEELDYSWWLEDDESWDPYDHLPEQEYQEYLFDRSIREF